MTTPDFFVSLDQFNNSTLRDLATSLTNLKRKKVADVTLGDLASTGKHANGIYLMYSESELWYVGKCTSRSFIERVPSHFDQREGAWFATVPHRIKSILPPKSYANAHAEALELNLALIGIQNKSVSIRLERALRAYLKPKLNAASHPAYSGNETICSVCGNEP